MNVWTRAEACHYGYMNENVNILVQRQIRRWDRDFDSVLVSFDTSSTVHLCSALV